MMYSHKINHINGYLIFLYRHKKIINSLIKDFYIYIYCRHHVGSVLKTSLMDNENFYHLNINKYDKPYVKKFIYYCYKSQKGKCFLLMVTIDGNNQENCG